MPGEPPLPTWMRRSVPLARYTSMRVGGPASYFAEPPTIEKAVEAAGFAADEDLPILVLGRGSNIVVSDRGFPGLVIHLGPNLSRVTWDGRRCYAEAGAGLSETARDSARRGLSGLQRLAGIPGSLGGAIVMNAGAFDAAVSDRLTGVVACEEGRILEYGKGECAFGYRTSRFAAGEGIVLAARFELDEADPAELSDETEAILSRRARRQPWYQFSAGSVFKRPVGYYAGALVEASGLKGFRIGGAEVSIKHAGFIVNSGGARASDIKALAEHVRKVVYDEHGVELEFEIRFVGEFEEVI